MIPQVAHIFQGIWWDLAAKHLRFPAIQASAPAAEALQ